MAKNADSENTDNEMNADTKRLSLWIRLVTNSNLIEKEVRNLFRSEFGVTLPRFDLMAALYREPGGLTMGELSKRMLVSNGNVTGIVERLKKEGLVKRWVLPTDRRIYSVGLTPKGRTDFKILADSHREWVADILGGLDEDEITPMIQMMDRMRDALHSRTKKTTEG